MRTSHSLFVAGEAWKYFSALAGELKNGLAFYSNNLSEEKDKIGLDWFKNDEKFNSILDKVFRSKSFDFKAIFNGKLYILEKQLNKVIFSWNYIYIY